MKKITVTLALEVSDEQSIDLSSISWIKLDEIVAWKVEEGHAHPPEFEFSVLNLQSTIEG
jgi:hypothetical protein